MGQERKRVSVPPSGKCDHLQPLRLMDSGLPIPMDIIKSERVQMRCRPKSRLIS